MAPRELLLWHLWLLLAVRPLAGWLDVDLMLRRNAFVAAFHSCARLPAMWTCSFPLTACSMEDGTTRPLCAVAPPPWQRFSAVAGYRDSCQKPSVTGRRSPAVPRHRVAVTLPLSSPGAFHCQALEGPNTSGLGPWGPDQNKTL
ncbi:unnamed protein product [Symbiodinium natans]|uniref:Uncharacterized protein n=1 Tax=Symbiodinium natans TaxID=878477 RepID=A0A812TEZ0_9DINO|nr:unnamed protein product [Symbiodinium natans]